jgi:hypothetical protein
LTIQRAVGDLFAEVLNSDYLRLCGSVCLDGLVEELIGWRHCRSPPKDFEEDLVGWRELSKR